MSAGANACDGEGANSELDKQMEVLKGEYAGKTAKGIKAGGVGARVVAT